MSRHDPGTQWKSFGEMDPYYGVLSQDRFKRDKLDPAGLDAFYATGEDHVQRVLDLIRDRVDPGFSPGRALDFGCGVGRLTLPLARRFAEVTAVDVSPGMIERAKARSAATGAQGISWVLSQGELPELQAGFSLIVSDIVLQHLPVPVGMRTLARLFGLLAPGGVAAIEFPVKSLSHHRALYFWAANALPLVAGIVNLGMGREWSYPHMQMNRYRLDAVTTLAYECGLPRFHVELFEAGWTRNALLLAQRPTVPA